MTKDQQDSDTPGGSITAKSLRQAIAAQKAAKSAAADRARADADQKLAEHFKEFIDEQVTQKELDDIRQRVLAATERGEFEIDVLRFPAKWCSDHGRAINNADPIWPETLQGKARNLYDLFMDRAQPQGFKLKAQILDFPGGLPGDVGLTLTWK